MSIEMYCHVALFRRLCCVLRSALHRSVYNLQIRPGSHLCLRSRLDLAPKRLESRLSHHVMTRLDLQFSWLKSATWTPLSSCNLRWKWPTPSLPPFEHNDFDQYPLWLQFLLFVKAAIAKQQISKFYTQIQRTEASDHIYFSQRPVM